jgi:hypothetical protein
VGEGRENDQAESIRDGFSGQRETSRQGGLVSERVRYRESCNGERDRELNEGTKSGQTLNEGVYR